MHAMHAHPIKKVNGKRSVAFLRPPQNPFGTAAKSLSCKAAVVSPLYFIKVQILAVNSGPLETISLILVQIWWDSTGWIGDHLPKKKYMIYHDIMYKVHQNASKCTCLSHMVSVSVSVSTFSNPWTLRFAWHHPGRQLWQMLMAPTWCHGPVGKRLHDLVHAGTAVNIWCV